MIQIFDSLKQVLTAIDACIELEVQIPTTMLLYATIDSCGWLVAENEKAGVGVRFVNWVDKYLQPAKALPCRAIDLYSARCGVLHTMTAESTLIESGKAKPISYAWGNADVLKLQALVDHDRPGECVAVHINDLVEAVKLGILKMFEDASVDPELEQRLRERNSRMFIGLDSSIDLSRL
jgi:hypothetical protein